MCHKAIYIWTGQDRAGQETEWGYLKYNTLTTKCCHGYHQQVNNQVYVTRHLTRYHNINFCTCDTHTHTHTHAHTSTHKHMRARTHTPAHTNTHVHTSTHHRHISKYTCIANVATFTTHISRVISAMGTVIDGRDIRMHAYGARTSSCLCKHRNFTQTELGYTNASSIGNLYKNTQLMTHANYTNLVM